MISYPSVAVKFYPLSKGAALFAEMGVGKTKILIDVAELLFLHKAIKTVLVIAPLSILGTWNDELKKHSMRSSWIELIGNKRQRLKSLEFVNYMRDEYLHWAIINADGIAVIKDALVIHKFDLVIIDESTIIKNRTTQRSKMIIELFQGAKYKVIASGNPIPKGADEIFSQYNFVEPAIFGDRYYSFTERYFEVDYFNKIVSMKNADEFYEKFHSIAFVKKKQDCLDLPPKIYERRFIDMSPEQERIYKEMEEEAIATYKDKTCAAPVTITKFLRCSQIAGGIFPGESGIQILDPNPKLDALVEELNGLPKDEQTVIWARFNPEIEIIEQRLKEEDVSCVTFYGKTDYKERIEARKSFKEKETRVFIGNPATGGKGLNDLIGATTVIYYSNDYSAENRQQSEDRNHRNGTVKVTYIDLLMKDTIDLHVLNVLQQNKDFSDAILNKQIAFAN
jgi:SNF2 family DNA or RNA helicase